MEESHPDVSIAFYNAFSCDVHASVSPARALIYLGNVKDMLTIPKEEAKSFEDQLNTFSRLLNSRFMCEDGPTAPWLLLYVEEKECKRALAARECMIDELDSKSLEAAVDYIAKRFLLTLKPSRHCQGHSVIYAQRVQSFDVRETIFRFVKDVVINRSLERAGLLREKSEVTLDLNIDVSTM